MSIVLIKNLLHKLELVSEVGFLANRSASCSIDVCFFLYAPEVWYLLFKNHMYGFLTEQELPIKIHILGPKKLHRCFVISSDFLPIVALIFHWMIAGPFIKEVCFSYTPEVWYLLFKNHSYGFKSNFISLSQINHASYEL